MVFMKKTLGILKDEWDEESFKKIESPHHGFISNLIDQRSSFTVQDIKNYVSSANFESSYRLRQPVRPTGAVSSSTTVSSARGKSTRSNRSTAGPSSSQPSTSTAVISSPSASAPSTSASVIVTPSSPDSAARPAVTEYYETFDEHFGKLYGFFNNVFEVLDPTLSFQLDKVCILRLLLYQNLCCLGNGSL